MKPTYLSVLSTFDLICPHCVNKSRDTLQTGLYSAWDNISLPLEGPEEDYFEDFTSSSQDDYKFFLHDRFDESGHRVRVLRVMMEKYILVCDT